LTIDKSHEINNDKNDFSLITTQTEEFCYGNALEASEKGIEQRFDTK